MGMTRRSSMKLSRSSQASSSSEAMGWMMGSTLLMERGLPVACNRPPGSVHDSETAVKPRVVRSGSLSDIRASVGADAPDWHVPSRAVREQFPQALPKLDGIAHFLRRGDDTW